MARQEMNEALDCWNDEGGAQFLAQAAGYDAEGLAHNERRLLECLGVAVVGLWRELPTAVQRALFQYAVRDQASDAAELKAQIARFLHDHAGQQPRSPG